MKTPSTLSRRGVEYTKGPNLRQKFKQLLTDLYDPISNPNGFVNLGLAENVRS